MKRIATATILLVLLLVTACTQYIYVPLPRPDKNEVVSLTVTETVLVEVNGSLPSTVKATAEYENGNEREVTATVIGTIDTSTQGVKTASAEYDDVRTTFDVTVYAEENVINDSSEVSKIMKDIEDGDIIVIGNDMEFDGTAGRTTPFSIPGDKRNITIIGNGATITENAGSSNLFDINGENIVIDGFNFEMTNSSATQLNLFTIQGTNVTIRNCTFSGTFNVNGDDSSVTRGFDISGGASVTIENCEFRNVRQPAYINDGGSGTIRNCTITGTRGWVIGSGTNLEFENNSFINNAVDIAIIDADSIEEGTLNNYSDAECISISQANGNCYVQNQITKIDVRGNQVSHYE